MLGSFLSFLPGKAPVTLPGRLMALFWSKLSWPTCKSRQVQSLGLPRPGSWTGLLYFVTSTEAASVSMAWKAPGLAGECRQGIEFWL